MMIFSKNLGFLSENDDFFVKLMIFVKMTIFS